MILLLEREIGLNFTRKVSASVSIKIGGQFLKKLGSGS